MNNTMWMSLLLLMPLMALAYVGWHIWCLLPLGWGWRLFAISMMVVAVVFLFAGVSRQTDRMPLSLATIIYEVGTSALVILLYLFLTFCLLDVLVLLHILPSGLLRESWLSAGCLVAFLSVLFFCGNLHYKHKYRQELNLRSEKLGRPYRLVMLSDMHLGYHIRRKELARWVNLINAEEPDLILIAGDIIDNSTRPLQDERMHEEFLRLSAPVYACLGNHEYYSGRSQAHMFYRDAGIHLLCDSAAFLDELCIVGRDDRSNPRRRLLRHIVSGTDKFCIVLDHQPYQLQEAEQANVDFQLSGHTHHGQVWPISWITDVIYECAFGFYQRGATNYYISSGIGIWGGKFRIGTRSEYVVLNLMPEHK